MFKDRTETMNYWGVICLLCSQCVSECQSQTTLCESMSVEDKPKLSHRCLHWSVWDLLQWHKLVEWSGSGFYSWLSVWATEQSNRAEQQSWSWGSLTQWSPAFFVPRKDHNIFKIKHHRLLFWNIPRLSLNEKSKRIWLNSSILNWVYCVDPT